MSQLSFLSIGLANKKLRCQKFLDEMSRVVPWNRLVGAIKPYYFLNDSNGKGSLGGRPAFDLELMLKIHCLQQWFGLTKNEAAGVMLKDFDTLPIFKTTGSITDIKKSNISFFNCLNSKV